MREIECVRRCGFVAVLPVEGDVLDRHEREEHVPCTECGEEPAGEGAYPVSHKPDCRRLSIEGGVTE